MTREEAVKRIKRFLEERNENCDEDEIAMCFVTPYDADALDMAIKALEQEPCEDAINRSETIKYLNINMEWYDEDGGIADSDVKLKAITDLINGVPSVQPKQEPCKDAISRRAMLDYQQYLHGKMSNEENHKLWEFIKDLPSVTSVQKKEDMSKWIPISKLMPEEHDSIFAKYIGTDKWSRYMFAKISDQVLVTRLYPDGSKLVRVSQTIDGGQWTSKSRLDDKSTVVAWMPLPEPYGGK